MTELPCLYCLCSRIFKEQRPFNLQISPHTLTINCTSEYSFNNWKQLSVYPFTAKYRRKIYMYICGIFLCYENNYNIFNMNKIYMKL